MCWPTVGPNSSARAAICWWSTLSGGAVRSRSTTTPAGCSATTAWRPNYPWVPRACWLRTSGTASLPALKGSHLRRQPSSAREPDHRHDCPVRPGRGGHHRSAGDGSRLRRRHRRLGAQLSASLVSAAVVLATLLVVLSGRHRSPAAAE